MSATGISKLSTNEMMHCLPASATRVNSSVLSQWALAAWLRSALPQLQFLSLRPDFIYSRVCVFYAECVRRCICDICIFVDCRYVFMNTGENVDLRFVAGHLGLTIGWIVPSVFILCVAMSIAELTSSMPWVALRPAISPVLKEKHLGRAGGCIISRPNLLLQVMRLSSVG